MIYRRLKHNEIIREGDEIDSCADGWRDEPKWETVATAKLDSWPQIRLFQLIGNSEGQLGP